jgi:hypothetical protein
MGRIDQAIVELGRQLDGLRGAAAGPLAAEPFFPPDDVEGLPDLRRQAADRVLNAPVFRIESVPLEDFALARAFLDSADSRGMPREAREELVRRIGIYDRRVERERLSGKPRTTLDERRQQVLLRQVIDKCATESFAGLTLGEIDLLIHSYNLLVGRGGELAGDDRLLEIVNRAVDEVCMRWASLERLRDALASRR